MKLDNLLSQRVLVLDYFTFLKNLQTIPVTDPSVSTEVAEGFKVLTAYTCEQNVEISTEWYVVLDSILSYFDTSKTFWLYSGQDYELFLRFLLCVRNDLFGRKATLIRSLIGTLDNNPADEIEPQQTEANKIMVKSFLVSIYDDLLEGMAVADTLYREVRNAHNHLLYNNDIVTYPRNAELNDIVYQVSRRFHRTIRKLTDLVQSGNIVENLQTSSSLVSPYFQYPFKMHTRLVEYGTLSYILSQYFGNPPKKVADYDLHHDSLVLFSKKESIWTLDENKEWDRKQRCHYTALLLYHARPELSFMVQRNPPECFLVVLHKEHAQDILSGGYPYKRVFIDNDTVVQVSKSRCLYGFLGEI